jgi:hypothetical protein
MLYWALLASGQITMRKVEVGGAVEKNSPHRAGAIKFVLRETAKIIFNTNCDDTNRANSLAEFRPRGL